MIVLDGVKTHYASLVVVAKRYSCSLLGLHPGPTPVIICWMEPLRVFSTHMLLIGFRFY